MIKYYSELEAYTYTTLSLLCCVEYETVSLAGMGLVEAHVVNRQVRGRATELGGINLIFT